jgi:hypothetical protein
MKFPWLAIVPALMFCNQALFCNEALAEDEAASHEHAVKVVAEQRLAVGNR